MKLSYIVELIAEVATGLLFLRIAFDALAPVRIEAQDASVLLGHVAALVTAFLAGVSLAGGIGLVVESWRGRSPVEWGWGRWVWAVTALYTLVSSVRLSAMILSEGREIDRSEDIVHFVQYFEHSYKNLALLLVVSWLTARLACVSLVSKRDAREWAGRFFAGAFVLQLLVELSK